MTQRIVLVGAGNVASQLSLELKRIGCEIVQVYSRTKRNASELASKLGCLSTSSIHEIVTDADIFIVSVSDNALESVLQQLPVESKLIVHTSGSMPMSVFKNRFENYGVFYPLQTFSKNREVDFSTIPFCIEANSAKNFDSLKQLAMQISKTVIAINSDQRKQLHLAAVFANNFSNYLFNVASKILSDANLPFNLLMPLIVETASKASTLTPAKAQTGPAVRNDRNVLNMHLEMLMKHPELQNLYSFVSDCIYREATIQNGLQPKKEKDTDIK